MENYPAYLYIKYDVILIPQFESQINRLMIIQVKGTLTLGFDLTLKFLLSIMLSSLIYLLYIRYYIYYHFEEE